MQLERAKSFAEGVRQTLSLISHRIEITGSVWRNEPIPNDIDLAVWPVNMALLRQAILRNGLIIWERRGKEHVIRSIWGNAGQVDFQLAEDDEDFERILSYRTRPKTKPNKPNNSVLSIDTAR